MRRRREQPAGANVWPAFTDVLAALVVVLIFLVTVFVIGEVLTSREAMSKDTAIGQLASIVSYMEDLLGAGEEERKRLQRRLGVLETELAERERALARARAELSELRTGRARMADELDRRDSEAERLRTELAARERAYQQLSAAKERVERLSAQAARQVASLEGRVKVLAAELARLNRALYGTRERLADTRNTLEAREAALAAANERAGELEQTLARKDARLQRQASRIEELDRLIKRRLVERVEELEKYASDFFGRLREVFAANPDIKIVGDRFVFQSEVLFPSGAAKLTAQGRKDLHKFVEVYQEVEPQIPADLPVIIEVQGHTDRVPIHNERFRSNWELSIARALGVVDYLIGEGIPPERLAAVGMGQYHPIDPADTPAAYRKNRRIELKITRR